MFKNFLFLLLLVKPINAMEDNNNPFFNKFKEIYNSKEIEYPVLGHKYIIYGDELPNSLTGKNITILLIDGNNGHTAQAASLINDPVCGMACDIKVIIKQYIYYKRLIDESLPCIIKEVCSDNDIDFISISFQDMLKNFHDTWKEVFLWAKDRGIGILMSAGNDKECLDTIYPDIDKFLVAMDYSFLFVLASTYEDKTEKLAEFSNYPNQNSLTAKYCITAPGVRILSRDHLREYQYFGGTSAAAPLIAAVAAIVKEAKKVCSSSEVLKILVDTSRKERLDIDTKKENHTDIKIVHLKAALQ